MKQNLLGGLCALLAVLVFALIGWAQAGPIQVAAAPLLTATPTPFLFYFPIIINAPSATPTLTPIPTKTYTPLPGLPTVTPTVNLNAPAPLSATSYYIQTDEAARMYQMGCNKGTLDKDTPGKQDSLLVLVFGQGWIENGVNGSLTVATHVFLSMSQIEAATKNYMQGYWDCSATDNESTIFVAVGTNNFGNMNSGYSDDANLKNVYTNQGRLWAEMVGRIGTWLMDRGYASQIWVAGANDIEWSTGLNWKSPTVTRGWVDGFDSADQGTYGYFNFGACVGCPITVSPSWVYGNTAQPWTQEHIWYVSWGVAPAWPLPEIYRKDGYLALQWRAISQYAKTYKGLRMDFAGPMTEYQACQQCGGCTYSNPAYNLDNTPTEGWTQLYQALAAWPDTAQPVLRWVTDIRYQSATCPY